MKALIIYPAASISYVQDLCVGIGVNISIPLCSKSSSSSTTSLQPTDRATTSSMPPTESPLGRISIGAKAGIAVGVSVRKPRQDGGAEIMDGTNAPEVVTKSIPPDLPSSLSELPSAHDVNPALQDIQELKAEASPQAKYRLFVIAGSHPRLEWSCSTNRYG
jgi:hypothetical protein